MTTTTPRPAIDWNHERRAIAHALECGPRLGWAVVEGTLAAAEVKDSHGIGDAVTLTYTRGTGSARQTVTARFRVIVSDVTSVDFYRFVGGEITLDAAADAEAARTWVQIMGALYSPARKAHRAPKGARRA